jgi:hypothetical protein
MPVICSKNLFDACFKAQILAFYQTRHLRLFSGSVHKNWRFYSSKSDNCSVFTSVVFYKLSEYILECGKKTHRRVRRKLTIVCDPWLLGCNQRAYVNCTPVAFQHPLMRLRFLWFFVKYLLWFGALLLGWNEGRVLPSYVIFQTSLVKPAPYARQPKIKLRERRTPIGGAADEVENRSQVTSVVLYFVRVRISPYKSP